LSNNSIYNSLSYGGVVVDSGVIKLFTHKYDSKDRKIVEVFFFDIISIIFI
jgi:hypothetical protein